MNLHNRLSSRLSTSVFLTPTHPGLLDLQAGLKTGALNLNRSTVGSSLRLPSVGLGRSSNGAFTGLDLLRVLTVPRSMLVETRPFDANHVVPGVSWLDPEEPEATLELSLEAAMEQGLDLGATAVEVEPVGDDQR